MAPCSLLLLVGMLAYVSTAAQVGLIVPARDLQQSGGACADDNTRADKYCKGTCKMLKASCGKTQGCGSWSGDVADFCPKTCGTCALQPSQKPTQLPAQPCPSSCQDAWESCIAKGYSEENCRYYALKGYLCSNAAGNNVPCTPCNIAPKACATACPKMASGPQMVFDACGGCQATCENKHPVCSEECHVGCFCPQDTPIFDEVTNTCIKETECPAESHCENMIAQGYLSTGVLAKNCTDTTVGGICKGVCATNYCVRQPEYANWDDRNQVCSKLDQYDCGVKSKVQYSEYCQWVGDTQGVGTVFACESNGLDGGATWVINQEGSCGGGGDVATSVCDLLQETNCLNQGKCQAVDYKKCGPLIPEVQKVCFSECLFNSGSDKVCGACLSKWLFSAKLNQTDEEPAVFKCCGCLKKLFAENNVDSNELTTALYTPCKQK